MFSFSAKGYSRLICCQVSGMYYVYNTFQTRHYQSFCTLKPHLFQYFSKCFVHFRLKNVMFDICPCEEVGDFEIKAKFLGVEMEKVQLHFQVSSQVHRAWHKAHALIFFSQACRILLLLFGIAFMDTEMFFTSCVFYYQDLLQLQYEGVAVMKMFDKAKVNVNLLIFLLNKKFYGK